MFVEIVKSYYDEEKHRNISKGDQIQVTEKRFRELAKEGIVEVPKAASTKASSK